jgi:hypothetical protein
MVIKLNRKSAVKYKLRSICFSSWAIRLADAPCPSKSTILLLALSTTFLDVNVRHTTLLSLRDMTLFLITRESHKTYSVRETPALRSRSFSLKPLSFRAPQTWDPLIGTPSPSIGSMSTTASHTQVGAGMVKLACLMPSLSSNPVSPGITLLNCELRHKGRWDAAHTILLKLLVKTKCFYPRMDHGLADATAHHTHPRHGQLRFIDHLGLQSPRSLPAWYEAP